MSQNGPLTHYDHNLGQGCEWHGHCADIPIETIAHIYGFVNTLFSSVELLCYVVLCSALHVILERQKQNDINVCDMSLKTLEDPDDDCEIKAGKVAAALLAISVFEVLLSFLALRGAYKTNVYFCYIWFVFTSLLVIVFPLFQVLFFVVTNWWNAISYSIMSMSALHSLIKLYGMYIIMRFVIWARERSYITHHGHDDGHMAVALSHNDANINPGQHEDVEAAARASAGNDSMDFPTLFAADKLPQTNKRQSGSKRRSRKSTRSSRSRKSSASAGKIKANIKT